MDNISLYAALGAFLGALVSGCFVLAAQRLAQRNENLRHARKLALELAVAEWQRHFDYLKNRALAGEEVTFRSVEEYFIAFLPTVSTLLKLCERGVDPDTVIRELDQATVWEERVRAGLRVRHHSVSNKFLDFLGTQDVSPPAEQAGKE